MAPRRVSAQENTIITKQTRCSHAYGTSGSGPGFHRSLITGLPSWHSNIWSSSVHSQHKPNTNITLYDSKARTAVSCCRHSAFGKFPMLPSLSTSLVICSDIIYFPSSLAAGAPSWSLPIILSSLLDTDLRPPAKSHSHMQHLPLAPHFNGFQAGGLPEASRSLTGLSHRPRIASTSYVQTEWFTCLFDSVLSSSSGESREIVRDRYLCASGWRTVGLVEPQPVDPVISHSQNHSLTFFLVQESCCPLGEEAVEGVSGSPLAPKLGEGIGESCACCGCSQSTHC